MWEARKVEDRLPFKAPATSENRFRFAAYFFVTSNAAATTGLAHCGTSSSPM